MMYTCNTCSLQFPLPEDQRTHMKSDWHRYNLKRRVAGLPAIDEPLFNEKVSKLTIVEDQDVKTVEKAQKQLTKKEQRRKEKEALLEKKKELLEIARQNMLKSMNDTSIDSTAEKLETLNVSNDSVSETKEKPKQNETPKEETKDIQPESEPQSTQATEEQILEQIMQEKLKNRVDIPLEVCLFCNKKFPYFDACATHMAKYHGFYIPEQKYLVDKEGLVRYMAEKIGVGNLCIVCDFQGRSLEAVRAHMLAKKHCSIPYHSEDEKLEISEFYDFSSTYKGQEDGEWEDIDEEGELVEGDDEDVVQVNGEDVDDDLPQEVSYDDGVELHLPNAVKIGHRALARYYRQNLRPERILSEGQGTVIAAESRHLATVADRQQLMEKKRVWKNEKHHQDRDDRRAAKFINNQPHYRDQLLQ